MQLSASSPITWFTAAAVAMCSPAAAQDAAAPLAASDWSVTGALLVSAADSNRDGTIEGPEWMEFIAGLRISAARRVDRNDVVARILAPLLDTNGNGVIEVEELASVHTRWDVTGDGVVDAADSEMDPSLLDGEIAFVHQLVLRLADAGEPQGDDRPHDDRVTSAEWARFVEAQPQKDGVLLPFAPYGWVVAALELPPAKDREAFTPDVYLMTLFSDLDLDKDGVVTIDDVMSLHGRMDFDGDGIISPAELLPPTSDGAAHAGAAPLSTRERFPPASAEQRAKPPLAPFQRSLDDALLLMERTGKPLLLCVNMDNEAASDAFAWYLYRDPAFTHFMHGYVCLIASPDDRQPLDHDDRGRRIEDARFGRVLDREAIEVEPLLYERYFRGSRAAPRHVGVSPSGEFLFDVYLVDDLGVAERAIEKHAVRPDERPAPADELSLLQLLDSPEAAHRSHLEKWFVDAGVEQRRSLAAAAFDATRRVQHPQIVWLALRDPDASVRLEGVRAVASRPGAVREEVVLRALDEVGADSAEAQELLKGVRRWAFAEKDDARRTAAERLIATIEGRRMRSPVVDVERSLVALALAPVSSAPQFVPGDFDRAIDMLRRTDALLEVHPTDAHLLALRAAASLRCGNAALAEGQNPLFHFQDAAAFAERAGESGLVVAAQAAWLLSDFTGADEAATAALPNLIDRIETPEVAEVLRIFANVHARPIHEALAARGSFDAARVANVIAVHAVLARHPLATRADRLKRIGFLESLGATSDQLAVVHEGLGIDPADSDLHAWMRALHLRRGGAAELRAAGAELVERSGGAALTIWYQGLCEIAAAEHLVRARWFDEALTAYDDCRAAFDASVRLEPGFAPSAAYYSALAASGAAHVHLAAGRFESAVTAIEEAFDRDGGALDQPDGLGRTPRAVAEELRRVLVEQGGENELVARVEALLERP